MTFQPYPTRSGFVSLGVVLVSGVASVYLVDLLIQPSSPAEIFRKIIWLLLTLIILGIGLYLALIAFRLQYHLNRNGLAIQWGPAQYIIPFEKIETIIPGKNLSTAITFRGVNIAGLRFGKGEAAEYGSVKFRTTAGLVDSLLVVVKSGQSFVISPRSPETFLKAWRVRKPLGPNQQWSLELRRSWPFDSPLATDPVAWLLLGVSALACLASLGYLSIIYPDLPSLLPIHYDGSGQARIAEKSTLLLLPAVGAIILGANAIFGSLIYYAEKVAAYLLWGSTLALQLCLWIALLYITA